VILGQNRPENVSGTLALAAGTHSDWRFASVFVTAPDGLTLHVRRYGPRVASALPVVCLPGLARTAADFHPLAEALAADPAKPRLVLALDYRGHGRSEYDRNPDNYTLPVALADLSAVLIALEIAPAIFLGTSYGGLRAMMLAVWRPTTIAGVILNDIGPVMEPQGWARIKSYVKELPIPRNFEEGAEILRWWFEAQFPKLAPQDWLAFAQRTWREHGGRLVPDYDLKLARTLQGADLQHLPMLLNHFDALRRVPLMNHPRRQFRYAGPNHASDDAVAARRALSRHSAGSGSRAAAGRAQADTADCSFCCFVRRLHAELTVGSRKAASEQGCAEVARRWLSEQIHC
jgi:pimeloyl-ACP methyl ester carboxylesterase